MTPANNSMSALTNDSTTDSATDEPRYGEITECEICETERHCTDHCGMVTCRRCQDEFLP